MTAHAHLTVLYAIADQRPIFRVLKARCRAGKDNDCVGSVQRPGTTQVAMENALVCAPVFGVHHWLVALATASPSRCDDVPSAAASEAVMKHTCSTMKCGKAAKAYETALNVCGRILNTAAASQNSAVENQSIDESLQLPEQHA